MRMIYLLISKVTYDSMCFLFVRVVHALTHNFRNATCIVQTPLRLPIEPHHVLIKVIHAGVNASDVSLWMALKFYPFKLYL